MVLQVPKAKAALRGRPKLGGSGRNGAKEAANLSLPERVRPDFEAERAVRVYGGTERKAEDAGASALGHEFREWNGVVFVVGSGRRELAVEELEHVIEALGGGSGVVVVVVCLLVVVFFIFRRIDEAAVGVGGWEWGWG